MAWYEQGEERVQPRLYGTRLGVRGIECSDGGHRAKRTGDYESSRGSDQVQA